MIESVDICPENFTEDTKDHDLCSLISTSSGNTTRDNVDCAFLDTYDVVQELADLMITDARTKLDEISASTKRKRQTIAKRTQIFKERQKKLMDQNGGSDVNISGTINLNVGGKHITASRNILTFFNGSCLEVLFSGRWENKILRDDEGLIFLDIDPDHFTKMIQSFLTKIVNKISSMPKINDLHEDKEDYKLLVNRLSQVPGVLSNKKNL